MLVEEDENISEQRSPFTPQNYSQTPSVVDMTLPYSLPNGTTVIVKQHVYILEQQLNQERMVKRSKYFGRTCLPYIFYDKPVKTGSTAVTFAIREYIEQTGSMNQKCSYTLCTPRGKAVCNGSLEPMHLIGHIHGGANLTRCLKERGYYSVTSIREPLERWKSSFLYNRQQKGNHYGILWNVSYSEFMSEHPDCSMYKYYDQMSRYCDRAELSWEERLKRIVEVYDEVIELDQEDGVGGVLFERIREYLEKRNVSVGNSKVSTVSDLTSGEYNESRLIPERRLYDALREHGRKGGDANRFPC